MLGLFKPHRRPLTLLVGLAAIAGLVLTGCSYEGSLGDIRCDSDSDCEHVSGTATCVDDFCVFADDAGIDEDIDDCDSPGIAELCEEYVDQCGSWSGEDKCGEMRNVECNSVPGFGCGESTICDDGVCVCDDGLIDCDGDCVDIDTDEDHCSECNTPCTTDTTGADAVCDDGECSAVCVDDDTLCEQADLCTDLSTDDEHCGQCGNACGDDEVCDGGTCVCADGLVECDGDCVDTDTDADHCGDCQSACGDLEVCSSGSCTEDCPSGLQACDGGCVDTDTDENHCGDCQSSCAADEVCTGGICEECIDDGDCDGCQQCSGGSCVDDSSQCSGCEECSDASCIDDSSQCSAPTDICQNATCIECIDDTDCSGCESCDDSGVCVDDNSLCDGCQECTDATCTDEDANCADDDYCADATCVDCLTNDDCAAGEMCSADNQCVDETDCDPTNTPFGNDSQPYLLCSTQHVENIADQLDADFEIYIDVDGGEIDFGDQPLPGGSLGSFSGKLDGNGHAIANLSILQADADQVGLFSEIEAGATVQNLDLTDIEISGDNTVGALTGINRGIIDSVVATGSIDAEGGQIGGLIGRNEGSVQASGAEVAIGYIGGSPDDIVGGFIGFNHEDATVSQSYATGDVDGGDEVGGFVGSTEATISDSFATGAVNGASSVGGFAGAIAANTDIDRSYAYGIVSGDDPQGFAGNITGNASVNDCYYNDDNNDGGDAQGLAADADGFGAESNFSTGTDDGWDFQVIWEMLNPDEDDGRPVHQ